MEMATLLGVRIIQQHKQENRQREQK